MRASSLLIAALALAPILSHSTARAGEPSTAGALVGGSYCLLGLELGSHSGDATVTEGQPRDEVGGLFGLARVTAGAPLRVSRFGSEAGLEGSFAFGYIAAGAFGGKEEGRWAADISGGVVLVPYRSKLVGGSSFKLGGGFGSDHDVDYLYASGRFGFGEFEDTTFGLEAGYTYRVGDAPSDATLTEHRVDLRMRIDGFAVGLAWMMGESARYRGTTKPRVEVFQEGTMRKGDYSDWVLTLGYAWR